MANDFVTQPQDTPELAAARVLLKAKGVRDAAFGLTRGIKQNIINLTRNLFSDPVVKPEDVLKSLGITAGPIFTKYAQLVKFLSADDPDFAAAIALVSKPVKINEDDTVVLA